MHIDLASKAGMFSNQLFKSSFSVKAWKRTPHTDLTILSFELSPLDKDMSNFEQNHALALQAYFSSKLRK